MIPPDSKLRDTTIVGGGGRAALEASQVLQVTPCPAPLHCAHAPPRRTPTPSPWPALRAARHAVVPRRPVILRGPRGPVAVGSVAEAHLPALAAWPQWIAIGPEAVTMDIGAEIEAIDTRWARSTKRCVPWV